MSGIRGNGLERFEATQSYERGANFAATAISIRAKRSVEDNSDYLKGKIRWGIVNYFGAVSPTPRPRC